MHLFREIAEFSSWPLTRPSPIRLMNSAATSCALFKNVAFVVYPVTDVKVARRFYEGPLGLTVTANWSDQWVEYDVGDGTLAITVADATHRPGIHGATVGPEIADFDAVVAHLGNRSVPFRDGPFDSTACRGCVICDPDGNEIILHAWKLDPGRPTA